MYVFQFMNSLEIILEQLADDFISQLRCLCIVLSQLHEAISRSPRIVSNSYEYVPKVETRSNFLEIVIVRSWNVFRAPNTWNAMKLFRSEHGRAIRHSKIN